MATSPSRPKPLCLPTCAAAQLSPRRLTIYFEDDGVRERSQANVQQLLTHASAALVAFPADNTALLARKALKFRKLYDRMTRVDVTAPTFNASTFLGVDWCHTPCLKTHCASRPPSKSSSRAQQRCE